MKHSDFVHLHTHTLYSLLDGACRIEDIMETAREFKMPAAAITDHGNMFGAIHFYTHAMKQGIKPIIGAEMYLAPKSRFDKSSGGARGAANHITLLAKDETGYQNLMKLVSAGYTEGFYYKPRVDKEMLSEHSRGIIALSGCLKGTIPQLLLKDKVDKAVNYIGELAGIFSKNFYLEIQDHGLKEQKKVNKLLIRLSKEINIPLVATNDVHYIKKEHAQAHEALLCLQTQTTLDDPGRMRLSTNEFYFKSPQEMKELFKETPEAIRNTIEITERCNLELSFDKDHLPRYKTPNGINSNEYLTNLCLEGAKKKYTTINENLKKRLDYELNIIENAGFTSYFLMVWDFVKFAKSQNIPVGPGRGSAAGSVVAYVLDITGIDPIQHNLIFERFLNPERISLPDIDIDFCYERRQEVIDYVANKYGKRNVAQIITFGSMAARAVIRDVARVMSLSYNEADKIAKMIPSDPKMTLNKALKLEPDLKKLYENDEKIAQLINTSKTLEGLKRHASMHAAGVVISEDDLTNHIPLFKTADDQITTGYDMESLKKIGLVKMDFLGLKTLTVIDKACKIVKRVRGDTIDINGLPLNDKKTYKLLSAAKSMGVFQLESSGMRDLLRKLKPEVFDDIVALLALYRPGPLGSGLVDEFIKRKHGKVPVVYVHPQLKPILKDTYGVLLHQDQIMVMGIKLAGFSLAQADILMRAISKKRPEEMEELHGDFIKGAAAGGINKNKAEEIFTLISHFTGYGFNKAHTTCYAAIAYQTAYLKANYPVEFMTALLSSEKNDMDKIALYIEDAKKLGIEILPPDVNESFSEFTVIKEKKAIRFGLSAVKNVGEGAINSIIKARLKEGNFKSLYDLCKRIDSRLVNRRVIESLIKCGAFHSFRLYRSQLTAILDKVMDAACSIQKDKASGQLSFLDGPQEEGSFGKTFKEIPQIDEWPENQLLAYEKDMLGFYITGHPLAKYEKTLKFFSKLQISRLSTGKDGSEITIAGVIAKIKQTVTKKKGEKMAIVRLEDLSGQTDVLVFPKSYAKCSNFIKIDAIVFIKGRLNLREETPKIIADEIISIKEARTKYTSSLEIKLLTAGLEEKTLKELKEVLAVHPGRTPVYLNFISPQGKNQKILANSDIKVKADEALINRIEKLVGQDAVFIEVCA
ncbi:MAG: DNA polymerase III subunit alpha [Candidatus Omnitrophica bacterium]|nr:DNA polymerase III subunit alpha [Candidatus Omnitrophota bacterium]